MKIVYCIRSLHNSGGMERVLTTKANYLADHMGYEVYIITRTNEGEPFFTLSPRIKVYNLQAKTLKEFRKRLTATLFNIRPAISISLYGAESHFLYKINDGSKKIIEFHFSKYYLTHLVNGIRTLKFRTLHRIKAWWLQKREEQLARQYDKVILLTRQDLMLWGQKNNMCYIPNPLSFRSTHVSALESKRIIAVGRFIAQKGFDLLIDAFALIHKQYPDWSLDIYGEGQDHELLNHKITSYSMQSQVRLLPPEKDIRQEFLNSSLLLFPSRYEGFGLVLTEAMECGLPCIAFDCECGPSEIIEDGITGYLVPVGDVKGLSEKMEQLITHPTLLHEMGENARKAVKRFYPENIMHSWELLFEELMDCPHSQTQTRPLS